MIDLTPLTECPACTTTMRPDVLEPQGPGINYAVNSRVECTHCGHTLGRLEWSLP